MKTLIYLFLFLLFRIAFQEQLSFNCEENKMHAVYYATKCCDLTTTINDPEFTKCHAKYSKMTDRPPNKLKPSERIAINICAHECSLLKKNFLRTEYKGEFNPDSIEDYYQAKYHKKVGLSTYMTDAFRKCIKFDSIGEVNIKYPNVTFLPKACDPLSARIMMCVRTKAMQSCPSEAWQMSADCGIAKLYFKECVGSIEKVVRAMD